MKRFLKLRTKGFTLIELMIVIAIIAILAAILVPNFIRARAQAQLSACESNLKNMATAQEMYATDNSGNYITAGMAASANSPLSPNYVKVLPTCPAAGTGSSAYFYIGTLAAYTMEQNTTGTPHSKVSITSTGYPMWLGSSGLTI